MYHRLILTALLCLSLGAVAAHADGKVFPSALVPQQVEMPNQRALLARHDGTEKQDRTLRWQDDDGPLGLSLRTTEDAWELATLIAAPSSVPSPLASGSAARDGRFATPWPLPRSPALPR